MIELLVKNHLATQINVPVLFEHPQNAPSTYLVVEKTSGSVTDYLKSARIAIQSYGASLFAAATLNEQVKAAMDLMARVDEVSQVELNSDYNFTDTNFKEYRYQAVFDINYY